MVLWELRVVVVTVPFVLRVKAHEIWVAVSSIRITPAVSVALIFYLPRGLFELVENRHCHISILLLRVNLLYFALLSIKGVAYGGRDSPWTDQVPSTSYVFIFSSDVDVSLRWCIVPLWESAWMAHHHYFSILVSHWLRMLIPWPLGSSIGDNGAFFCVAWKTVIILWRLAAYFCYLASLNQESPLFNGAQGRIGVERWVTRLSLLCSANK